MRNNAATVSGESLVKRASVAACAIVIGALTAAAPASAGEPVIKPASYPDMTTYSCRTDAIDIHPGQNINDYAVTKTCPHAEVVSGPGNASIFDAGSSAEGFITRFKPSMLEVKPGGRTVTPSVWDLHLHHVVWLAPGGGPTFASGEEKTIASMPKGYGFPVEATANWGVNQMLHNLGQSDNRQVYLTWEIDWVPQTTPARTDIIPTRVRWMDVAGAPQIYPVFDAEKGFDRNGDGRFVFPDEVPDDPSLPGYEERRKISSARMWTVPASGATLLFTAGHLHPGGKNVKMMVARDGPDPGTVDGDDPSEVKNLFKSTAKYYEPAGAVSWDVAMRATPRDWRISLKPGDTVFINVTYDVHKASWYESMGIMPVSWVPGRPDPAARDPFDDAAAVAAMYGEGGELTHRRLPENIDTKARKDLGLPNPRKLKSKGRVPASGIDIRGFYYQRGGFTAVRGFPARLMRPPVIKSGQSVTFTNLDALPDQTNEEQAWHSITSCRLPCNQGSGIGYPLANGPIKFDSGQLGYGKGIWSSGVTTGSNTWTTPPLTYRPGKSRKKTTTYTYFCRIHPLMRGSIRVRK